MANRVINKVTSTSGNLPPVLLDLTSDTVNERNLERDQTAHNSGGQKITGQMAIEDAEAWARGTRNGTPVPSSDETYQNNSLYYSIVSGSIMRMAGQQAIAAATSANNAAESERAAGISESNAANSETAAENSAIVSGSCMNIAGVHAGDAEAWAIGKRNGQLVPPVDPAYNNNSKYYKDLCESIAGSLVSVLKPKGTCLFADLPEIADSQPGDLWNIEDEFTTTSDFREGAGRIVAAGSDVYLTIDNKWDILAGTTSDYIGATSSTAAIHGLMPAAQPGEQDKVIFGDGRWKNLPQFKGVNGSIESVSGLLPEAPEGAEKKVFYGKGEWDNLPVFQGISGSMQSTSGMLPAAESGDEDKVFNGRGEWGKRLQIDIVIQNGQYGYINANNEFVDFKSQADIDAAVRDAMVGTATAADVLTGTTFTNSSQSGISGEMVNNGAVSPSGLNCGGSYTIPAGYHNGSGKVTANSLASQTGVDSGKTAVTAGTMVSGYQGWVNGSKISGTFAGQTKSVTATTVSQDVTPDSGKYLTKVTVSPQTHSNTYTPTANSSASDMGKNHNYRYVDTRTVYNLGFAAAPLLIDGLCIRTAFSVTSYNNLFTTSRAYIKIIIFAWCANDNDNYYIDVNTTNTSTENKRVSLYDQAQTTGSSYNWKSRTKAFYYADVPSGITFRFKGNYAFGIIALGLYKT